MLQRCGHASILQKDSSSLQRNTLVTWSLILPNWEPLRSALVQMPHSTQVRMFQVDRRGLACALVLLL